MSSYDFYIECPDLEEDQCNHGECPNKSRNKIVCCDICMVNHVCTDICMIVLTNNEEKKENV